MRAWDAGMLLIDLRGPFVGLRGPFVGLKGPSFGPRNSRVDLKDSCESRESPLTVYHLSWPHSAQEGNLTVLEDLWCSERALLWSTV